MMRDFLNEFFRAAVAAADPALVLPAHLPPPPAGRTLVVGAGKAAARMALAVEKHWPAPLEGLVVTPYGHADGLACRRIEVVEAAHPVPDARGEAAARRIMALAGSLTAQDMLLCLISGGGSALLALPAEGLTLADKQAVNAALLRSGASISEINTVRKHLSAIKGGRLAVAAWPAKVVTLIVSDVPGDDPAVVASGPTVADPSTFAQAREIVRRYAIATPALEEALADGREETPKPGDARLAGSVARIVACARDSLEAAAALARGRGWRAHVLGDAIEGEARAVAQDHAALVRAICAGEAAFAPPCVLISGGETSVTMRGGGRGGRNGEYALALALALDGLPGVCALAADTDGIDGSETNAGAFIDAGTLARARALGLDPQALLCDNDSFTLFEGVGDLFVTGPTCTNVNDFRAIAIGVPHA